MEVACAVCAVGICALKVRFQKASFPQPYPGSFSLGPPVHFRISFCSLICHLSALDDELAFLRLSSYSRKEHITYQVGI